jgi:hypothetical protein
MRRSQMSLADLSGTDRRTVVVHSPADGGYYLEQSEVRDGRARFRVSKRIWPTSADARRAWLYGDVKWGKWS